MENLLIYEMESESQSEGKSQEHEHEPIKPIITQKQDSPTQIIETKTIHVHSNSSDDSPKKLLKSENELVFYDDDLCRSTTSMDIDETKRVFLKKEIQYQQNDSDLEQQQEDEVVQLDQLQSLDSPNLREIKLVKQGIKKRDVTVKANRNMLVKQIVPLDYKLTCFLSIQRNFLGIVSRFKLWLGEKREFMLSAKKEVFKLMSTFTISNHNKQINKRNDSFVGVLQGNFIGTEFKLLEVREEIQQLKLVVNYQKNIVGFNGPRMFTVMKLHPQVKSKHSIEAILLQNQKQKLIEMKTSVPVLKKGKYRLDFQRKAKIPSAKNFILEREDSQSKTSKRNAILFCKIKEDEYLVQISYPLSILQAFSVCLSSLDSKLMVN